MASRVVIVAVVIDAVTIGLPLVGVVLLVVRRRHWLALARAADRAEDAGRTRAGETVAHGVVQVEDGTSPIAVEIDEREHKLKMSGDYQWTETARRIAARPFGLRTASGEHIEVVPDDRVLLVRPLDGTAPGEARTRTRKTALQPGEAVYVVGVLERAIAGGNPYRDGSTQATMRAPRRGRLTISTAPLRDRFERHAEYLASKALGIVFLVVLAHCLSSFLWNLDLAQLHRLLAWLGHDGVGRWLQHSFILDVVRCLAILVSGVLGFRHFFVRRAWHEGKVIEDETAAERRSARR